MSTKLSQILAEISAGELLDKITILEIKREKITDSEKLKNGANKSLYLFAIVVPISTLLLLFKLSL